MFAHENWRRAESPAHPGSVPGVFHVEMRAGSHVVREFNLNEQRLWLEFLAPLMADVDFTVAGHDFTPRKTRLAVYEGPELRSDQLGIGRGWQNVERTAVDVTERVLARAREHTARTATRSGGAEVEQATAGATPAAAPASVELLRERLIGRLSAGPVTAQEIEAAAAELMPDAAAHERLEIAKQAAWALLERGVAQLGPIDR